MFGYPVVIFNIALEDGPFTDVLPFKIVIFHSYVSLPEGIRYDIFHVSCCPQVCLAVVALLPASWH